MLAALMVLLPLANARAGPGALDPAFGGDGRVALPAAEAFVPRAVAADPEDRIVVGGYLCRPAPGSDGLCIEGGDASFRLARLTPDGGLDPEFGANGLVTQPIGEGRAEAYDVLLTDGGRILAGGVARSGGREVFTIACFLPDGSLDPSWGDGGVALAPIGSGPALLVDIAAGPGGTVVAAGQALDAQGIPRIAVARFLATGALDPGFGQGGATLAGTGAFGFGQGLITRADGSALVAGLVGETRDFRSYRFAELRVGADGAPDPRFGTGGFAEHRVGSGASYANAATAVPGGWVAAGAATSEDGDPGMAAVRGRTTGRLVRSFGRGGRMIVPVGVGATANDVLADGERIVLVGQVRRADGGYDFGTVRLLASGARDRAFGAGGIAAVDWPDYPIARATAGVLQSRNRLVTVGLGCVGGTDDACTGGTARLLVARQHAGADRRAPAIEVVGSPRRVGARRLRLRFRLSEPARLSARLRRGGATLARRRPAEAARDHTLRLVSRRALRPGRYRLTVRARDASGNTATRRFTLRVRR